MTHPLLIYILIVISAGSLSMFLCLYALFKIRDQPGGKYFILAVFLSGIFAFSYAFELVSVNLKQIMFWIKIEYLMIPFIPVFVLLMCTDYIGSEVKRWQYYLLFGLPVLTIFFHYTNEFHHLYYLETGLRNNAPFPVAELTPGFWFYVHSVFLYLCIAISIIILIRQYQKRQFIFRMQIVLMVTGLLIPVTASIFYISGLSPHGIDLGPVSMSVSFLFHGAALVSLQMFNVAPIARDSVFESMKQGVIVLNHQNVIVDYNKAAQLVVPALEKTAIGKPLANITGYKTKLTRIILNRQECDYEVILNDRSRWFHLRFSPVLNKKSLQIGEVITFLEITEIILMQEKLKKLANMDSLTGISNRNSFITASRNLLESCTKKEIEVSVVIFDIDYFKKVNDTYGHEAGDRILVQVSQLVQASLSSNDIFGRYGGEEFVICLPGTGLEKAYDLAETVRTNISHSSLLFKAREIKVTASFGLTATDNSGSNSSIQSLIDEADQALYRAKKDGRNCVYMYDDSGSFQDAN